MIPDKNDCLVLLKKYAPNDEYYELVKIHGEIVYEIAEEIASRIDTEVNMPILQASCLLHDIGSYVFLGARNFSKDFARCYPGHAIFGAKILQDEGLDDRIWQAIETHVLQGIAARKVQNTSFALPEKDYIPRTIEAKLLCYADRFHSKHPVFNDFDDFIKRLEKRLPNQAQKLKEWSEDFGIPDVQTLSKKHGHPIR